jgi:hypothetical protein
MRKLAVLSLVSCAACVGAEAAVADLKLGADEVRSPTGLVMKVQNVGLPAGLSASGIPPLGVGVLPSAGRGGDGNFQVTQLGGWSGGAGAIKGYGGQWTIPLSVPPGSAIANTSCDVFNPSPNIAVTFELVSGLSVISSVPIPSSTTVVIRAWHLPAYRAADGESPMLRLSARNSMTGAYASISEQPTVISCALHVPTTIVIPIQNIINTRSVNLNSNGMGGVFGGNVNDPDNGFVTWIPLQLGVGTRISGWRVRVQDSIFGGASSKVASQLSTTTDNSHIPAAIATSSQSSGVGAEETITGAISISTAASTQYWISVYDAVGASNGFVRRLELDLN